MLALLGLKFQFKATESCEITRIFLSVAWVLCEKKKDTYLFFSLCNESAISEEAIYKNISSEADDLGGGGGGLFSDAEVEARFEYLTEGVILTIVSCVGLGGRDKLDAVENATHAWGPLHC